MTSLHIRAEAAALGAILHEPRLLEQLAEQLGPAAWERPWHAQVWGAMSRLRSRKEKPTPQAVAAEVARDPDIHDAAAAAVQVAELMEAAPRPEHAASYARMVGDASRRRTLMGIGRRLAQAATWEEAAETVAQAAAAREALGPVREAHYGPPPRKVAPSTTAEQRQAQLDELLAHADDVRARAEAAAEPERSNLFSELARIVRQLGAYVMEIQWKPVPAHPDQQHVGARELAARSAQKRHARREAEEQDATAEATQPDDGTPRRTFEAGPVEPDAPTGAVAEVERARETAERQMLAAIAADPAAALAAAENVTRDQWADTWRRDIATLAAGLHAAGEAVDPLTLEWAARQAGVVADRPTGDQIPAAELADALRGPYLDPAAHAQAIGEAATRITVAEAAEQVLAAADDPTVEVTATMDQLDAALARVAPDPPQASAAPEAQTSDDVEHSPTPDVPNSGTPIAPEHEQEAGEAQPVTAAPTAPVDTSTRAGQPVAPTAPQPEPERQAERHTGADAGARFPGDITPDMPVEAMAQAVIGRILRKAGDRADGRRVVDRDQVERVLRDHPRYKVDPDVAREAADRVAQLDVERVAKRQTSRTPEVPKERTTDVPEPRTSEPQAHADQPEQAQTGHEAIDVAAWNKQMIARQRRAGGVTEPEQTAAEPAQQAAPAAQTGVGGR